jgi:hypothetical protein
LLTKAPAEQRNLVIGYGLVLFGALGFSTKAIIIKLAYAANDEVDAITLMALRMLFALPFFFAGCGLAQQKISSGTTG